MVCIVLFCPLVIGWVLFKLITTRPADYNPLPREIQQQVHPYLTHYLAPQFNNQIQLDRPFEIIVDQNGINEIIVNEENLGWSWPITLNGVTFSAPTLVFEQDTIYLMGTVDIGFPIIISMIAKPRIDEQGKLWLNLLKMNAGSLNIIGPARLIGGKIFEQQMAVYTQPEDRWIKDTAAAFLKNTPFDPVFPVPPYKKYIRLLKAEVTNQRLILVFGPAGTFP